MSYKNIEILEADLKIKESQEIKDFGMVSLGTLAQQEILRLANKNYEQEKNNQRKADKDDSNI